MPSDERTLRNGSSTKTAAVKAEDVQEGNNRAGNLQVATDRILDRLIDMLKVYICMLRAVRINHVFYTHG